MIDIIDEWRARFAKIPPKKNVDNAPLKSIAEIEEEGAKSALRILKVGNLQILHVVPEVTQADVKFEFDTDIFMKHCTWAREDIAKFTKLKNWEKGMYIYGKTGCGKTVFMKAKALDTANKSSVFNSNFVKFVNFGKLMHALGKDNWIYKPYILEEMRRCTHLFIDDIGTESGTTHHEQVLTELLDNRIFKIDSKGREKTTSFSSNKKPNELPYHPRVIRRIQDMAATTQVFEMDNAVQNIPLKDNPSNS